MKKKLLILVSVIYSHEFFDRIDFILLDPPYILAKILLFENYVNLQRKTFREGNILQFFEGQR